MTGMVSVFLTGPLQIWDIIQIALYFLNEFLYHMPVISLIMNEKQGCIPDIATASGSGSLLWWYSFENSPLLAPSFKVPGALLNTF